MIKITMLCVIMAGGAECVPFRTLAACLQAEAALADVMASQCSEAEITKGLYGWPEAPITSPLPKPRKD